MAVQKQQPSLGRVAVALFHDEHEGDRVISPVERQSKTHRRSPLYKEINADRQPLLRERVYHNSTAFASVFCAAARSGMGICMRVTRGPRASGWGSHVSPPFYRPPLFPEGAIFTRGKARSKEVLRRKRRGLAFSLLPLFEKEISILE